VPINTPRVGPLAGIRVLDLGTVVAGPFMATLLGDFGADVIKVEIPGRGDTLRQLGPVGDRTDSSYWFAAEARNKRSVTLDLRTPEGKDLFLRLVDVADVVVENFVPGTMAKWRLGADILTARKPGLIVAHASGYGQSGPYASRPGYDRVGLAFGGLWNLSGNADEPMRPGVSLADYLTGTFGALGVVMALYQRDTRGGMGQEVDAALYESIFRTMEFTVAHHSGTGVVRQRVGNRGPSVPTGGFRTKDGRWLSIAIAEDGMYRRLMTAIGRPDLAADPRLARAPDRLANRNVPEDALQAWIESHDADEALAELREADIPVGEAMRIDEIAADPHYAARDMLVTVDDPVYGPLKVQGVTPKLSATPGSIQRPAPLLGEHNEEVYCGLLGLDRADLERLRAAGVI